ncbi:MAG: hypothetical protein QF442_02525 [Candidatus Peribacteraceae bacterium]|jgi:hypothetical protein|nr:hypothetical protein [Candidatus Peribacteraceae bacterium]
MQKQCKKCGVDFTLSTSYLKFLEDAGPTFSGKKYPIAQPSLCSDCREQRRLAWRNERFMYKRKCDSTGKDTISMYPPESPFTIYDPSIWWGDSWDPMDYGRDFDFSRPFFEQFRELQLEVPRMALVNKNCENSDYTNHAADTKNCFMSATTFGCEDIYYGDWIVESSKDLVDCSYMMKGCEVCYETYYAHASHRAYYCEFVKRCSDVWFCFDCINCNNCFLSCNLRNKEYCFENEQLTKDDYQKKISELSFSYSEIETNRERYKSIKRNKAIHPDNYHVNATDSTGDLLFGTENCFNCYDAINCKDCEDCYSIIDVTDSINIYHVGWAELMYECHAIANGYNCIVCHFTYDNKNALYCDSTQNCSDVLGCCGLRQKKYCIFNKQYTKEDYENLAGRIIEHMSSSGEWGEFFPLNDSPFAYNQTRAPEFYPLTKEKVLKQGMRWSDYEPPDPNVEKVIPAAKLPEKIPDIPDDILNWAIACEVTNVPFQIVPKELEFYRTNNLPVPRRHPNQRYDDRIAMRNLWNLHSRKCSKCQKDIQTTFTPEQPETVYCKECYLKEVY